MSENNSIIDQLQSSFVPDQPRMLRKHLTVKERGVEYRAKVDPERETIVFQVDGDIIKEGNKCDKLILSEDTSLHNSYKAHFVELKGRDIPHAVLQLEATLENDLFKERSISKRYARVVGRSFPSSSANPEMEKAKKRFKTKYGCELKMFKSGQVDTI